MLSSLREILLAPLPNGRQLKKQSVTGILANIKYVWKILEITDEDIAIFKDVDLIHEIFIEKFSNIGTRKTALSQITTFLSPMGQDRWLAGFEEAGLLYRKLLENYRDKIDIALIEQPISTRDNDNWISTKDLKAVATKLRLKVKEKGYTTLSGDKFTPIPSKKLDKHRQLIKDYMIATLYTEGYTQRNVYGRMIVINSIDYNELPDIELRKNYLVILNKDRKFFKIGDNKSSYKYCKSKSIKVWAGVTSLEINTNVNRAINVYLNYHRDNNYFLINSKGNPLGSDGLSKLIRRIFSVTGKSIGSTLIRKIYYTDQFGNDKTIIEKNLASKQMGNTPAVAELYYNKHGKASIIDSYKDGKLLNTVKEVINKNPLINKPVTIEFN